MYKLILTSEEFAHLQQAMWSYGFDLDEEYDTEENKTHQSIWKKIRDTEERNSRT